MYRCNHCGHRFSTPEVCTETHGLSAPPYEKRTVCPNCLEGSLIEMVSHCRCCGAKMNREGLFCCEACRKRAVIFSEREKKRKCAEEPINRVLREKEAYNRSHGTTYSYGQYVALHLRRKHHVRKQKGISVALFPAKQKNISTDGHDG